MKTEITLPVDELLKNVLCENEIVFSTNCDGERHDVHIHIDGEARDALLNDELIQGHLNRHLGVEVRELDQDELMDLFY